MPRRRKPIQNPEPMKLGEFIVSKVRDLENSGKEITLGTLEDGIWQESQPGEAWDTIRVGSVWDDCKYVTGESLVKEHAFYIEQFETRMERVLGFY
jgi:hypothetical protein